MKNSVFLFVIIALSVAVGVMGSFFVIQGDGGVDPGTGKTVIGSRVVHAATNGSFRSVKEISLVAKPGGKHAVRIVETAQVKPGSSEDTKSEDVDEADLTPVQKAVLKELQDALDDNNIRRVRKALSKFLAKADVGGLGGQVPVCMRKRAVSALGWFGKDAAVDLLEYVADADESVADEACSQFELALSDSDMSDFERSRILTAALKAMSDGDQVDSLLNQLNDMRNSVKAQTAGEILTTGSDVAKAKMQEQMALYFDEGVTDADGLAKWQAMNPDDASDAETYAGADESTKDGVEKE